MGRIREYVKKTWVRDFVYFLINHTPQAKYLAHNIQEVEKFDRDNGTDFGGNLNQEEIGISVVRGHSYSPSPDSLIKTLDTMNDRFGKAILDIGCGKGYAMFIMSRYKFEKIGGVELSTELCEIAKKNLNKVMPDSVEWDVYNADAGKWDGYDEYDVFYLFNPVPEEVLREIENELEQSMNRKPRKLTIMYLMPAHVDVFINKSDVWKLVSRGSIFEQKRGMHIIENNICKL